MPLRVPLSPPEEIRPRLDAAFTRFEQSRDTGEREPAVRACAELWADVYRTHPFSDGNTRTSFVLLQAALHRIGQREFETGPYDWELAVARSYALRPDESRSIEPLAELISKRIRID